MARVRHRTVLDFRVGDRGAVQNRIAFVAATSQIRAGPHIDQEIRLDKPQVQHRTERLAPRDGHCGAFRGCEQVDRVRGVPRADVVEARGLHGAARNRCAVMVAIGSSMPAGEQVGAAPNSSRTPPGGTSQAWSTAVAFTGRRPRPPS